MRGGDTSSLRGGDTSSLRGGALSSGYATSNVYNKVGDKAYGQGGEGGYGEGRYTPRDGYQRPTRRVPDTNYSEQNPWPNDKHWNNQQQDSRELPENLPFLF